MDKLSLCSLWQLLFRFDNKRNYIHTPAQVIPDGRNRKKLFKAVLNRTMPHHSRWGTSTTCCSHQMDEVEYFQLRPFFFPFRFHFGYTDFSELFLSGMISNENTAGGKMERRRKWDMTNDMYANYEFMI